MRKIIEKNGIRGIILINNNKEPILFVYDNNWRVAEPVEKELFIDNFALNEVIEYGDIIGFMDILKEIVFKTKFMNKNIHKNMKGARCDNAGKKNIEIILNELKDILNIKNDGIELSKENEKKIKVTFQLCSEIELILRYLDIIKYKNKRWFFNYEEKVIYVI